MLVIYKSRVGMLWYECTRSTCILNYGRMWGEACTCMLQSLKQYSLHELILSVRGNEADASLRLKLAQFYTLMEGTVIDGYTATTAVP